MADDERLKRLERVVDELDTRVSTTDALALLPERITDLREDLVAVREDLGEERRAAREFRRDIWRAIAELKNDLNRRFDVVDAAHAAAGNVDWRTVLAVVTGVSVPIAAAIIATS